MKKLLSLFLAVLMVLSLATFVAAEATVTATVGSSDLTNATDVALSFKSIITLPQAVPTGTDLSGIVITGGGETLAPTKITKGKETDGTITNVTIDTPLLANATAYTLVVPALGNNEAASFDFTTVPDGYIVKEDFVGGYSTTWINKLQNDLTKVVISNESWLTDADGDGVTDMMTGITGDSNNSIFLPTGVPMDAVDELTIETRVRYRDPSSADTYTNEDGSLKDDNNGNNGGLFCVRGAHHNNRSFSMRTNADGYMTYGGSNGRNYTTDYKIYDNTWYTIRITFDAKEVNAKIYITDDNGNSYEGPYKQNLYGSSWAVTPFTEIKYSYGAYIRSDIKYLNVWKNDDFGTVTSTVNGATNVAKRETLNATLTFANDITAEDMAKIVVGDGATVNKTLANSKTVNLAISDLAYDTQYEINVPQLGRNQAKTFTFTTETEPVPSIDINGTKLDGRENIAVTFNGDITFVKPVATGTNLSRVTLSDGTDTYALTFTEGTVTNGYFTKATFKTPILKAGKTYTLSVPAIGNNEPKTFTFKTVPVSYLVKEDFDDGYSAFWTGGSISTLADASHLTDIDGDGVKDAMAAIGGGNYNTLRFPTYVSMADTTGLTIETRVKFKERVAGAYTLEDGSLRNDSDGNNGGLMTIRGNNHTNNSLYLKTNAEGCFTYGGAGADYVSDFKIYNDKWYTFKIEFNETELQAKIKVTDDEGNTHQGEFAGVRWGNSPINPISHISYTYNWFTGSTIDYLYVYDSNFVGNVNVTYNNGTELNGASGINANEDLNVNVTFEDAVTEEQFSQISVAGATVEGTLSNDGFSASLVISGLNTYEKTYVLNIPAFGLNEAKEVSFTTGPEPLETRIKQNDINVDDLVNMPLSFTPTIEFPYGVADATDLSGITIAREDGKSTTATITVTQNTAKDGVFTTAKAAIAKLERGTTYVISVPAYGTNEAKTVKFTTLAAPYYVSEEFNNGISGNWHRSNEVTNARVTATADTDGDGIVDSLNFDSDRHLSYIPVSSIDMSASTQIAYETRVKYKEASAKYVNSDGSINASADANNGGLLRFRGTAGSSWIRFRTTADGYLTYGQTNGDNYVTGCKIYRDKWYTIRVLVATDGKTFKATIIDEDGNIYDCPYTTTSYGGTVMKGFIRAEYSYGSFIDATIDYLRVWDNSALGDVAVTDGNGTALNGATNVPAELNANIKFANAITEADMAKITVSNGSAVTKTLSEDGLTVNLTGALDCLSTYVIDVPQIGSNKATSVSFTTEGYPVEVSYNGATLNGAKEVPTSFSGTISFTEALAADADISGITINGGSISATLANDGLSVNYTVSSLDIARCYTISVPGFGGNRAMDVKFSTVKENYLFKAEFDGIDAEDYALSDTNNTITDGILNLPGTPGGTTTRVELNEVIDITGRENLVFETRVKFAQKNGSSTGSYSSGKILFALLGDSGAYNSAYTLWSTDGYLGYGGNGDNSGKGTKTDYLLKDGMWYTIRMEFNGGSNAPKLIVTPDEGEGITVENAIMTSGGVSKIYAVRYSYRYQIASNVDYIRIYEAPVTENEYTVPVFDKTSLVVGETLTATVNYRACDAVNATLILALYNADGEVTRIVKTPFITETTGKRITVSASAKLEAGEVKARAFLWDSIKNMFPLTAHAEL